MTEEEKQLDSFLAKSKEPPQDMATLPTDESIVEQKAREKPLGTTVRQRKSRLDEKGIERNIAATLRRYPDIDESKLREMVAQRLDARNDEISEADYAQIVNALLKEQDKERAQTAAEENAIAINASPGVSAFASSARQSAGQLADWASALKTPGGIGLLVGVLIFFVWVVMPINSTGKTRMQLLWGVLTGQVGMRQDIDIGGGGGGDFGSQSQSTGGDSVGYFGGGSVAIFTPLYQPDFD